MRMRSMGACYWWPLFLICTVRLPGVLNLCFPVILFFFFWLMRVYAFLTANTIRASGYGARSNVTPILLSHTQQKHLLRSNEA